jgi:hypothetical protein
LPSGHTLFLEAEEITDSGKELSMDFTRSLRRLLYLTCSLVLLVLALAPSQAKAGGGGLGNGCPTPGDEIWYYSDATYTNQVGVCASDCCNCTTCTCSGQITPYAVPVQVDWFVCN